MLLTATVVFTYYTIWALFLVHSSHLLSFPARLTKNPSSPSLIPNHHCNPSFPLENGRFDYLYSFFSRGSLESDFSLLGSCLEKLENGRVRGKKFDTGVSLYASSLALESRQKILEALHC